MIQIFSSKVIGIGNLTPDVKWIKLSVPDNFDFKPGQYLSLSVIREDGKRIRKPFSIANKPQGVNDFIEFCAKIIPGGLASEFIRKMKIGDDVELFGPAGRFVVNDFDKDLVFIASGVGIAPFMSIIPDLLNKKFNKRIILLKSARNEEDSLYDEELSKLSKQYPNFEYYNIFSEPKNENSNSGYVQDFLEQYIPEDFNGNSYICGLDEMINDTQKRLLSLGFNEEQIFNEKFD
jgi:ferredoxin-NADP reductase